MLLHPHEVKVGRGAPAGCAGGYTPFKLFCSVEPYFFSAEPSAAAISARTLSMSSSRIEPITVSS